jgi:hypothetical protein
MIRRPVVVSALPSARTRWKYRSGGGSRAVAACSTPRGGGGSGAGGLPIRAKLSNRIGAAPLRPISPGTGAPSARPTQTPTVRRPSKPIDQASR